MGLLQELIGVDSQAAFHFFLENLRDPARTEGLRDEELLYVTSVLAHYAQTSRFDTSSKPCLAGLSEVFDNFLFETAARDDAELLEFGGSQVLLFAGFFRDQMQRRHNVKWYDQIGRSLYERASQHSGDSKRREFFDHLSESFSVWTMVCRDLHRSLRENRFLLRLA
jgi:hypothetical protein